MLNIIKDLWILRLDPNCFMCCHTVTELRSQNYCFSKSNCTDISPTKREQCCLIRNEIKDLLDEERSSLPTDPPCPLENTYHMIQYLTNGMTSLTWHSSQNVSSPMTAPPIAAPMPISPACPPPNTPGIPNRPCALS